MKGRMCKVASRVRKVIYQGDRKWKKYEVLKPVDEEVSSYREVGRRMTSWGVFNAVASNRMSYWFDSKAAKKFEKYLDLGDGKRRKRFKTEGLEVLTCEPNFLNLSDSIVEEERAEISERQLNLLEVYG